MNRRPSAALAAIVVTIAIVVTGCIPGTSTGGTRVHAPQAAHQVDQWARFEAALEVAPVPANPFDPEAIDVQAVFVDPHGVERNAIGFWYQDYDHALVNGHEQLTATGSPHFVVRFTPEQPGMWTWWWRVKTPAGVVTTHARHLKVKPHGGHGFLRRSKRDPRYLAFDDGTPYFAIGENLGWYDARGTYDYDAWLAQLQAQHANFARLWMPSWAFGIEWNDTGLGNYTKRLDRAWQLDHVFTDAQARGIYIELSLLNHGAFSTSFNSEWAQNPYNAANGGPLTSPAGFFTDATARKFFEQRLRYIVARWGSSTDLLAWELWNEVDLTDGYNSANVTAWHQAMSARLRDLDPYDHLVTTSHAIFVNDASTWANGGVDFTQLHFYKNPIGWFPNLSQDVVQFTATRLGQTNKPVLFAELGINSAGPTQTVADDPEGITVHDGLFAGAVSQGLGTAMTWWWDNVVDNDPNRYYPMFGAVAAFVHGVAWDRERFAPLNATARTGSTRPLVAYGLQGRKTTLLWLKDDAFQPETPQRVSVADATVDLPALSIARCGDWIDTWTGNVLAPAAVAANATSVAVPTFAGDVGLRLQTCAKG